MKSPWGTAKNLKETMMEAEFNHLNHATWECKYHVVFTPKYRKKLDRGGAFDAGSSSIC